MFLNIVLDDAVEEKAGGEKVRIGMVVRDPPYQEWLGWRNTNEHAKVIRGNSVVMLEVREELLAIRSEKAGLLHLCADECFLFRPWSELVETGIDDTVDR